MSLELSGTTGLKGVAGSVAAPSIVGDDTNTGISFPAADTIKFSTGGVERMSITNSGVSGITAGITMMDQWRLSNNVAVSANTTTGIYSNWERNDNNFAQIGTGMTESSGVFTFPTTGIYRVDCRWNVFNSSTSNRYVSIRTELSTDGGSNYNQIAVAFTNLPNLGETTGHATSDFVVDVTNASNFKVRTVTSSSQAFTFAGNEWAGINANVQTNSMTFIKLGDT